MQNISRVFMYTYIWICVYVCVLVITYMCVINFKILYVVRALYSVIQNSLTFETIEYLLMKNLYTYIFLSIIWLCGRDSGERYISEQKQLFWFDLVWFGFMV